MKSNNIPHPEAAARRDKGIIEISVVVPFFNEENHIQRCIQALLNQDFEKDQHEIIFINNNSSDRSREIVRRYPEITLLDEEKQGSYAARNRGIQIARGKIIAFCDSDCEVSADWLTQIHRKMDRAEASIILGKRYYNSDTSFLLQIVEDYENSKVHYLMERKEDKRYLFGFTNNMAVRTELFHTVGLFREIKRGADTEFVQRCLSLASNVQLAYLPEMAIRHLEMTGIKAWLGKRGIRGKNNRRIEKISNYKSLSYKTRIDIFRCFIKKYNYTFLKSLTALLLLVIGLLFYRVGELRYSSRHP